MLRKHNEQGSALLLTIIITMILLVLGGALASFSLIEKGQVGRDEGDLKAYYIARSGADLVAQAVLENEDDFEDIKGKTTKPVTLGQGSFTAKIEPISSGARIVSTGVVGSRKRTISLVLKGVSSAPLIDHAIYASGDINISGGVSIEGDVATSSKNQPALEMTGGAKIKPSSEAGHEGKLFISESIDEEYYDNYVSIEEGNVITGGIEGKDIPKYNNINFPETPSIVLSNSTDFTSPLTFSASKTEMYFDKVKIDGVGGTSRFTIDLAGQDCTLVIDELELSNQPNIKLINPGHLDLFVNKFSGSSHNALYLNLDIVGNPDGNDGDQDWLRSQADKSEQDIINLYYSGSEPFGASNADGANALRFFFVGNLITDQADIFFAQDSMVKGNILTNAQNIAITNNTLVNAGLIYAPNAHVDFRNGGQTNAIVCKEFSGSGGDSEERPFNIKFEPVDPDTLPIGVLPGGTGGALSLARSHWER